MTSKSQITVLVLCTGNSARSILGEALFDRLGKGCIRSMSAGSHPVGKVNPLALSLLKEKGFDTSAFRSKSWDEFAGPEAEPIDFIFTVCDNAAGEVCPIWPGHPMTIHWGLPDPAAIKENEEAARAAFEETYQSLTRRIAAFLALDLGTRDRGALRKQIEECCQ